MPQGYNSSFRVMPLGHKLGRKTIMTRLMPLGHNPSTRLMPLRHKVSVYGTCWCVHVTVDLLFFLRYRYRNQSLAPFFSSL